VYAERSIDIPLAAVEDKINVVSGAARPAA